MSANIRRFATFLILSIVLSIGICLLASLSFAESRPKEDPSMPTAHYKRVGSGDNMRYELDYYTVSNTQQLSGIRNLLAPEVPIYLTRDLWLNPDTNPTEKAFTPIGGGTKAFTGTFDGQGHTIYNLYIDLPDKDKVGLFGRASGKIKNLTVTGSVRGKTDVGGVVGYFDRGSISDVNNRCSVQGYLEVGGVDGYAGGNVTNSQNTANVSSTYGAGGIAGSSAAAITDCINTGNITVTETAAGGITSASSGTITNSSNSGKVNSVQQAGGIVGALSGKVSGCRNTGEISGSFFVGGIAARNYYGDITGSYNYGVVTAKNMAGGIVGNNEATVSDCHNKATVTANILVAGVAGQNKGTITGCTSTGKITAQAYEYSGGIAGGNDGTINDSHYQEGSASGTVGNQDSSTGSTSNSGVKDESWFDKNVPVDQKIVILSQDIIIEKDATYEVDADTNLVIPGGITATDKGTLHNDGTVTVKKDGTLVIDTTGIITGTGVIIVENGGKIINNSDKTITITTGDGSTAEVKPGETYDKNEGQTIKPDTVLSADTTIPQGETYPVKPGESLVIPGDVTLTVEGTLDNDGTVTIKDKGTIEVTETGRITGSGSLVVEAGGKIINASGSDITIIADGKEQIVKPGESYTHQPSIYINAQADTGGSISPAGKIAVPYGGSVTFAISPQSEFEIDNVAIDGIAVGSVKTYTFSNVNETHTIQAFFKAKSINGTTSTSSSGGCNSGGPKTLLSFFAPLVIYAGAQFMLNRNRRKQKTCEKNTEKE